MRKLSLGKSKLTLGRFQLTPVKNIITSGACVGFVCVEVALIGVVYRSNLVLFKLPAPPSGAPVCVPVRSDMKLLKGPTLP